LAAMNSTRVVDTLLAVLMTVVIFCFHPSSCNPTGAPTEACINMLPMHGSDPQNSPSPYSIQLNRNGDEFIGNQSNNQIFFCFLNSCVIH
jgi:hypothetical protein